MITEITNVERVFEGGGGNHLATTGAGEPQAWPALILAGPPAQIPGRIIRIHWGIAA